MSFRSIVSVSAAAWAIALGAATTRPVATDEALKNPGMGFVHYRFDNRMWAYGGNEPADYTCDEFPGTTVTYMRVPWCVLEPEEGKFRWDVIDSYAAAWIEKGLKIALRVTAFEDRYVYATPEWVRNAGAKGEFFTRKCSPKSPFLKCYDGTKLWEPDYLDPVFLAKLENFLKAYAARYDGNANVAFVDVGSWGVWGECHTGVTRDLPKEVSERIAKVHMDLHKRYFRRTRLVISDDFAGGMLEVPDCPLQQFARSMGIGYRDDSIMCAKPPKSWYHPNWGVLAEAAGLPVVIETGHFGMLNMDGRWVKGLMAKSVEDFHAHYMSIHGWPSQMLANCRDEIDAVNRRIGYRMELREVEYPDEIKLGDSVKIRAEWVNVGVAHMLDSRFVTWALLDKRGAVAWAATDDAADFRDAHPKWDGVEKPFRTDSTVHFGFVHKLPRINDPVVWVTEELDKVHRFGENVPTLPCGTYELAVSIGARDGTPEIALPLADHVGLRYKVGTIRVVGACPEGR